VMENADFANSVKSAECMLHGIECDPSERITKLLFTQPTAAGDNINLYNLGNFQLATQGMSVSGVNVGELWVSYDITFYKKQLEVEALGSTLRYLSNHAYTIDGSGAAGGYFNPTRMLTSTSNNLPLVFGFTQATAVSTMTFPANVTVGTYTIVIYGGFTANITPFPFSATSNCTIVASAQTVSSGFNFNIWFEVSITGPSAVITAAAPPSTSVANQTYLYVTQVNPSI